MMTTVINAAEVSVQDLSVTDFFHYFIKYIVSHRCDIVINQKMEYHIYFMFQVHMPMH